MGMKKHEFMIGLGSLIIFWSWACWPSSCSNDRSSKEADKQTEQELKTYVEAFHEQDSIIATSKLYPVYVERGEFLYYNVEAEEQMSVKIYNYDRQKELQSYDDTQAVKDSLPVKFSAIYLVEVTPKGRQYVNVDIGYRPANTERNEPKKIVDNTENCNAGDFLAKKIEGIKMKPVFEEPRKFTLRGQLKAAFSGAAAALVPVQVPSGATDILYNLQISTNENDGDGNTSFYNGMDLSYKKVRILGLPLYESRGGSGLLTTLLGLNTPYREEDAYINMYVFYNAADARKFQNGTPAKDLKYNLDYSTLGTQSCNGRIPTRGNKTIYLGFENERVRYNNYVWVSVLSSIPQTEYVRPKYTLGTVYDF